MQRGEMTSAYKEAFDIAHCLERCKMRSEVEPWIIPQTTDSLIVAFGRHASTNSISPVGPFAQVVISTNLCCFDCRAAQSVSIHSFISAEGNEAANTYTKAASKRIFASR